MMIHRKIGGDAVLGARFGPLLDLAQRVRSQYQHQRGPKVYASHAPEVECIGKAKARAPYEFGCKASIATPVTFPKGGQFVLHAKALHGNPFDGHTLGPVVADMEKLTGVEAHRIHVDKGYRGHNHPHRFRVWISGLVRRVTASIRREMKRRAARSLYLATNKKKDASTGALLVWQFTQTALSLPARSAVLHQAFSAPIVKVSA